MVPHEDSPAPQLGLCDDLGPAAEPSPPEIDVGQAVQDTLDADKDKPAWEPEHPTTRMKSKDPKFQASFPTVHILERLPTETLGPLLHTWRRRDPSMYSPLFDDKCVQVAAQDEVPAGPDQGRDDSEGIHWNAQDWQRLDSSHASKGNCDDLNDEEMERRYRETRALQGVPQRLAGMLHKVRDRTKQIDVLKFVVARTEDYLNVVLRREEYGIAKLREKIDQLRKQLRAVEIDGDQDDPDLKLVLIRTSEYNRLVRENKDMSATLHFFERECTAHTEQRRRVAESLQAAEQRLADERAERVEVMTELTSIVSAMVGGEQSLYRWRGFAMSLRSWMKDRAPDLVAPSTALSTFDASHGRQGSRRGTALHRASAADGTASDESGHVETLLSAVSGLDAVAEEAERANKAEIAADALIEKSTQGARDLLTRLGAGECPDLMAYAQDVRRGCPEEPADMMSSDFDASGDTDGPDGADGADGADGDSGKDALEATAELQERFDAANWLVDPSDPEQARFETANQLEELAGGGRSGMWGDFVRHFIALRHHITNVYLPRQAEQARRTEEAARNAARLFSTPWARGGDGFGRRAGSFGSITGPAPEFAGQSQWLAKLGATSAPNLSVLRRSKTLGATPALMETQRLAAAEASKAVRPVSPVSVEGEQAPDNLEIGIEVCEGTSHVEDIRGSPLRRGSPKFDQARIGSMVSMTGKLQSPRKRRKRGSTRKPSARSSRRSVSPIARGSAASAVNTPRGLGASRRAPSYRLSAGSFYRRSVDRRESDLDTSSPQAPVPKRETRPRKSARSARAGTRVTVQLHRPRLIAQIRAAVGPFSSLSTESRQTAKAVLTQLLTDLEIAGGDVPAVGHTGGEDDLDESAELADPSPQTTTVLTETDCKSAANSRDGLEEEYSESSTDDAADVDAVTHMAAEAALPESPKSRAPSFVPPPTSRATREVTAEDLESARALVLAEIAARDEHTRKLLRDDAMRATSKAMAAVGQVLKQAKADARKAVAQLGWLQVRETTLQLTIRRIKRRAAERHADTSDRGLRDLVRLTLLQRLHLQVAEVQRRRWHAGFQAGQTLHDATMEVAKDLRAMMTESLEAAPRQSAESVKWTAARRLLDSLTKSIRTLAKHSSSLTQVESSSATHSALVLDTLRSARGPVRVLLAQEQARAAESEGILTPPSASSAASSNRAVTRSRAVQTCPYVLRTDWWTTYDPLAAPDPPPPGTQTCQAGTQPPPPPGLRWESAEPSKCWGRSSQYQPPAKPAMRPNECEVTVTGADGVTVFRSRIGADQLPRFAAMVSQLMERSSCVSRAAGAVSTEVDTSTSVAAPEGDPRQSPSSRTLPVMAARQTTTGAPTAEPASPRRPPPRGATLLPGLRQREFGFTSTEDAVVVQAPPQQPPPPQIPAPPSIPRPAATTPVMEAVGEFPSLAARDPRPMTRQRAPPSTAGAPYCSRCQARMAEQQSLHEREGKFSWLPDTAVFRCDDQPIPCNVRGCPNRIRWVKHMQSVQYDAHGRRAVSPKRQRRASSQRGPRRLVGAAVAVPAEDVQPESPDTAGLASEVAKAAAPGPEPARPAQPWQDTAVPRPPPPRPSAPPVHQLPAKASAASTAKWKPTAAARPSTVSGGDGPAPKHSRRSVDASQGSQRTSRASRSRADELGAWSPHPADATMV
eukprot:TRINITY_DN10147_c0_g1_i2.p1 TRINITY_DN10147_c0_g1~~TRINITY_DN10147_c0_g1_i2.p1  ORF type:complete len:1670 (+),score=410.39 TRINITY_DN10147_c0_g1_i2:47-5056(+)